MTVLGAIVRPDVPPERLREVAVAADESGLAELWLWEDSFWGGGIALSGALLGMTERLRVGVGLLPIPYRNVAVCAMEISALDRAFPGRFLPGLGHGVQEWMAQSGVRAASPLTLMREYVTALRRLLAGQEVSASGRYVTLDRVKLEFPPSSTVPLHLGATGPKSLQVTGEVGDGTILVADTTLDDVPEILDLVEAGRADGGRTQPHELTVFVSATVGDPAAAAETVRSWAAAGAQRVVLQPPADEPDPAGFVAWVGRDVAAELG